VLLPLLELPVGPPVPVLPELPVPDVPELPLVVPEVSVLLPDEPVPVPVLGALDPVPMLPDEPLVPAPPVDEPLTPPSLPMVDDELPELLPGLPALLLPVPLPAELSVPVDPVVDPVLDPVDPLLCARAAPAPASVNAPARIIVYLSLMCSAPTFQPPHHAPASRASGMTNAASGGAVSEDEGGARHRPRRGMGPRQLLAPTPAPPAVAFSRLKLCRRLGRHNPGAARPVRRRAGACWGVGPAVGRGAQCAQEPRGSAGASVSGNARSRRSRGRLAASTSRSTSSESGFDRSPATPASAARSGEISRPQAETR
jgi:hypothetical protein